MAADPLVEMRNLADMRMSVHEGQRLWYARFSMALTLGWLLSSAFLLTFVFASEDFVRDGLRMTALQFKLLGGTAALLSFSAAITDLVWRPGAHAEGHAQARDYFLALKSDIARAIAKGESDAVVVTRLRERFEHGAVPRIPDERFLRLKRRYHAKVALSNAIQENPGASIWKLRRQMRRRGREE
jgi:hypothetical protein